MAQLLVSGDDYRQHIDVVGNYSRLALVNSAKGGINPREIRAALPVCAACQLQARTVYLSVIFICDSIPWPIGAKALFDSASQTDRH